MKTAMCKTTLPVITALAVLAVAPVGEARTYGAGIENSQWYVTHSIFDCAMTHSIPGFGRAVFQHRAGEALQFYLEPNLPILKPGRGDVVVEAPPWRPGVRAEPVGRVMVTDDARAVSLPAAQTMHLVDGLQRGLYPAVHRQARYGNQDIQVLVSNINFMPVFEQYQQCVSGLLPVNYDQVRRSRILFRSGSVSLSDNDRQVLENIVTYLNADNTVQRIFVDGHSDRIGNRIENRAMSERRANAVADYLRARGVSEDLLVLRYHGDRYPISRDESQNRRVTIRLEREGEVPTQQATADGQDNYRPEG